MEVFFFRPNLKSQFVTSSWGGVRKRPFAFTENGIAMLSDDGGLYIERAVKLLEHDMVKAAGEMPDALFVEYWGESVNPKDRIRKWLEKADEIAVGWKPSAVLFKQD